MARVTASLPPTSRSRGTRRGGPSSARSSRLRTRARQRAAPGTARGRRRRQSSRASSPDRTGGSAHGVYRAPCTPASSATCPACRTGPQDGTPTGARPRTAPRRRDRATGGDRACRHRGWGAQTRQPSPSPSSGGSRVRRLRGPGAVARRRRRGDRARRPRTRRASRCRPRSTPRRLRDLRCRRASGRARGTRR